MRLIDADKLMMSLADWELQEAPISTYPKPKEFTADDMQRMIWRTIRDCESAVEEQPTVKAIPIEWLHSIMERQIIFAMESEMEGTTTVKDGVIHCVSGALACQVLANVIKLWEKENETM